MGKLNKQIGIIQGIGLIVTATLGTSVFVVPAMSATIAGKSAPIAWFAIIVVMLPVALTFAELGKLYPHAGGTSHYLGRAFGTRMENFSGWLFISILPTGMPPAIFFAASYLHQALPAGSPDIETLSYAILLALAVLTLLGVKVSGIVQTGIAVIVSLMFFSIILLADLNFGSQQTGFSFAIQIPSLVDSIALIFWAFVGIEAVAHLGAEFKNPRRDYPLAIVLGILIVGILYLIAVMAVIRYQAYGDESTDCSSMALVFAGIMGDKGQIIAAALAFICCFSVINVYIMSITRMLYSMASNRVLPSKLAYINKRGVPLWAAAVALTISLCSLLLKNLVGFNVQRFMIYTNGVFIALYLLAMIAGFALLRGYKRWIALLAAILCLMIVFSIGWSNLYALAILGFSYLWDKLKNRRRLPTNPKSAEPY